MTPFLGALVLAATFISPSGEMCVVVAETESESHALYRLWPGGYRELLAGITFAPGEPLEGIVVADDGHFVTHAPVRCDAQTTLATIHAPDGSVVRTLLARDVLTANDQQWLCRGEADDVRFSMRDVHRMTIGIIDAACTKSGGTIEIDLATGAAASPPDPDRCPAPLKVIAEAEENLPRFRIERDVVPLSSQELLDRAIVRPLPEYPTVASRARVSGIVGVQVVAGRDGKVETAHIVKPLPFGLDEAVRKAIARWEFTPGDARISGVLAFRFEIVRAFPAVVTY